MVILDLWKRQIDSFTPEIAHLCHNLAHHREVKPNRNDVTTARTIKTRCLRLAQIFVTFGTILQRSYLEHAEINIQHGQFYLPDVGHTLENF